ncbi:MAG TPA: hypothetical protein VI796_06775 [Candidatus Thermoplasmatota archaeon]|nr:hypothetical protein [Candidatus Thermoplasmatota archaeon]
MPRDEHEIDARQLADIATGIAMTSATVVFMVVIGLSRLIEGGDCHLVKPPLQVGSGGVILVMLSYILASRMRKRLAARRAEEARGQKNVPPPEPDPRQLRVERDVLRHKGVMVGVAAASLAAFAPEAFRGDWVVDCVTVAIVSASLLFGAIGGLVATPALRQRWRRRQGLNESA